MFSELLHNPTHKNLPMLGRDFTLLWLGSFHIEWLPD